MLPPFLPLSRFAVLVRIGVMILFFVFRATHPNNAAYPLWLTSVICEIWSASEHPAVGRLHFEVRYANSLQLALCTMCYALSTMRYAECTIHHALYTERPCQFSLTVLGCLSVVYMGCHRFGLSYLLDQIPKFFPVTRETYLHRLALRFEPDTLVHPEGPSQAQSQALSQSLAQSHAQSQGQSAAYAQSQAQSQWQAHLQTTVPRAPSLLPHIDVFVSTADPAKEPPLVTANVILSVLAVDYPSEKVREETRTADCTVQEYSNTNTVNSSTVDTNIVDSRTVVTSGNPPGKGVALSTVLSCCHHADLVLPNA